MSDAQHNALLDAVDLLTKDRNIHTVQEIPSGSGLWMKRHTETHPPLLVMLIDGTGITPSGKSSDPGIPIDADALELWAQIRDIVRLWCKQLVITFDQDELLASVRRWYQVHANRVRAGLTSDVIDRDVTRMVEGWVRMIENKFDPPEKREWKASCPAWRQHIQESGEDTWSRCDARRVIVDKVERFAITLNITAWTAECCVCGTEWKTSTALQDLRYESNLWELEKTEREAERQAALERLTTGDTPEESATEVAV